MQQKKTTATHPRPAAFLDRDGVIVRDTGYVHKVEDLDILPGVPETLKTLHDLGFLLIIISNQAGVARGYFREADVDTFHAALQDRLQTAANVRFDAIYYCPHHPSAKDPAYAIACECRKPGTALIRKATEEFPIDLAKSFFVGDRHSDIACAIAAGLPGYQINSDQYEKHPNPQANILQLADVLPFAKAILAL